MNTKRRTFIGGVSAAALLSGSSSAFAQKKYDDGATDTEIKIGHSGPYSGPASAYGVIGKCIEAYWKMVNEQGGINGRKVNFVTLDDGYSPAKCVEVTHLFRDVGVATAASRAPMTFQEETRRFQAGLVQRALEAADWNVAAASRSLDLTRAHLYNLIKAFGLSRHAAQ